ncbi:BsuBI/PstI family type II restriction endonuclease [uncultured Chloroflexus sp.]|uniref:BsuBI/PstI family type II restriction endonuclease n=1 Tax=uncultured Chloroflexus sp. TaxID=214040 RepID=UPI003452DBA4
MINISPGGQNLLIEPFRPRFAQNGIVVDVGDARNPYINDGYLKNLGINLGLSAKMPDVIVFGAPHK